MQRLCGGVIGCVQGACGRPLRRPPLAPVDAAYAMPVQVRVESGGGVCGFVRSCTCGKEAGGSLRLFSEAGPGLPNPSFRVDPPRMRNPQPIHPPHPTDSGTFTPPSLHMRRTPAPSRRRHRSSTRPLSLVLLLLASSLHAAHAFVPSAFQLRPLPTPTTRRYASSSSSTSTTTTAPSPSSTDAASFYPLLEKLVEACLSQGEGGGGGGSRRDVDQRGQGVVAVGASLADTKLVEGLELMKVRKRKDGTVESGFLNFWNR